MSHDTVYGLIQPSAGRNRVKRYTVSFSSNEKKRSIELYKISLMQLEKTFDPIMYLQANSKGKTHTIIIRAQLPP